ncbi:alpha/beta hydrolase fold domain-containing protein [Amniculicola lignicola CBS 123094]|uniref:Alpha/beta hydrolase fold domain-containing protein n=1 Tax=Amniculicola lignicola CBS 123094 TaxID=1392246 RepID=A0A6A5W965_9PLEO|nr:alpha/beta hydrolase fold domain-containing protein [Amniculicola lignicola CBS 123094]
MLPYLLLATLLSVCKGQNTTSYSNGLDFTYPYPVYFYNFTSQQQTLQMAYMDISPPQLHTNTLKGVIALLHGKNFCSATWNVTIDVLLKDGYRVIVPDQIGFCKSTKPVGYQFTLHQLALNTNNLLHSLGVASATIMGHSMGGMISSRYALMYPNETSRLVLVDPLGLENWFALGVPYQSIDASFAMELTTTYASLKSYQQLTYYAGNWLTSYDVWIAMLFSIYQGPLGRQFAFNMAQTTDMIFTSPVIYELPSLKVKSLLIIGDKDTTAIGSKWAPADIKPLLGHYNVLGPQVAAMVPNCTLLQFADLGHAPQIQDPVSFHKGLLDWLP